MAVDMSVTFTGRTLPNPVMTASGCAANGRELHRFFDVAELGAFVTKSVMAAPRSGRGTPRMAETASGMLNSIGLQGPGIDGLLEDELPWLAERGVRVTLVEREAQLGGRVRSWPVDQDTGPDGPPVTMSRGFHAFFRQYYNLRALLRRVDPALEGLTPVEDYPLVLAGGHRDSFAGVPRTPPFNMAAFVAQSPSFKAADLAKIDKEAVWELLDVDFPATFSAHDGESAAAFLDRLKFPDKARHLALEVFARSFFAHPDDFAAGELVAMFHSYFLGSAEGLLFDVPVDDYDTADQIHDVRAHVRHLLDAALPVVVDQVELDELPPRSPPPSSA